MARRRGIVIVAAAAELARAPLAFADDGESAVRARCSASYEQAQTLRRDERLEAARAQLLVCEATCPDALARDCARWRTEVDALMPTVVLGATDQDGAPRNDARVTVDGHVVASPFGGPVAVSPGEHVFRFERRGSRPVEVRVELHASERDHPVTVVLSPFELAPSSPRPAPSAIPSLLIGGAGVLLLGVSGALAVKGHVDRSTLRSTCAPYCSDDAIGSVRTLWWTAAGLALGGAAALGVAVVLWPRQPAGKHASLLLRGSAISLSVTLP